MSEQARVDSIDAIKFFRRALFKFAEAANVALGDAESDMLRTLTWLETEQSTYWQGEHRKRTDLVSRCKEAVRMKQLFKDSSGRTPSAVDEEKALAVALRRLEEAEQKIVAVKRYTQKLQKEILLYKGQVQRFATSVQSDVPVAAAKIDAMVEKLEQYVALAPAAGDALPPSSELSSADASTLPQEQSMARAEPESANPGEPPPADEPGK
jgi:hypothetical protein